MLQEKAAAAVIIALISKKNKSRKKKPWLKRRKNFGFYEILPAKLQLEDKYYYKNYL